MKIPKSISNYALLFKSFVVGALLAEFFILARVVGKVFVDHSVSTQKECWLWVVIISYALIIIFLLINFWRRIWIFIKSLRFDLLINLLYGILLIYAFGGLGVDFIRDWLVILSWLQLRIIISLPIIVFISYAIKLLHNIILNIILTKKKVRNSLFVSDNEVKSINKDKFGFSDKAERFAEAVYNQGSQESLVFGIDAPWGTGKSSFVNLCKEYWDKDYKNKMIIYSFDPIKYENRDKLLEKFIEGFIKEIGNHVFMPEIEALVSRYAKLLKESNTELSLFGIKFKLPFWNESVDDVFERLAIVLKNVNKKIVIIVDDLDRLNFSAIKEVLFVIKKSFTLPNISYVLCYDTENISALDQKNLEVEKVIEFLEKFINIKISLYLDNISLLKYFTEYENQSLIESPQGIVNKDLISKAVEGLKDIFNSRDFHFYLPFISNARKLKRLINTIILLEVEKTDFENSDIDKQDLIHLLLIYINYPNIFRKIYNTETHGKRGFFSVVSRLEDGYPKDSKEEDTYQNSDEYRSYINALTENQKFILNKVFDVNQRLIDKRKVLLKTGSINPKMLGLTRFNRHVKRTIPGSFIAWLIISFDPAR